MCVFWFWRGVEWMQYTPFFGGAILCFLFSLTSVALSVEDIERNCGLLISLFVSCGWESCL